MNTVCYTSCNKTKTTELYHHHKPKWIESSEWRDEWMVINVMHDWMDEWRIDRIMPNKHFRLITIIIIYKVNKMLLLFLLLLKRNSAQCTGIDMLISQFVYNITRNQLPLYVFEIINIIIINMSIVVIHSKVYVSISIEDLLNTITLFTATLYPFCTKVSQLLSYSWYECENE